MPIIKKYQKHHYCGMVIIFALDSTYTVHLVYGTQSFNILLKSNPKS